MDSPENPIDGIADRLRQSFPRKRPPGSGNKLSLLDYLLLLLVPLGCFFWLHYRPSTPDHSTDVAFTLLIALVYMPIAWIMLREVPLRGWLRRLYSLTVMPLFLLLLVASLMLMFELWPGFGEVVSNYEGVTVRVFATTRVSVSQILVLPACLAGGLGCWLWYRLLLQLQRWYFGADTGKFSGWDLP